MPKYLSSETLEVKGPLDIASATVTWPTSGVPRANLAEDALASYPIDLLHVRTWNDLDAVLPETAASDDLGFIEGAFGTDAPTIQTSDAKATTVTQYGRFRYVVPKEYIGAGDIKLRIRAGMITTVSDGTATVDVECRKDDEDGGISADLCATAAQSCNSLTKADLDFTITATSVEPGDILDFRITVAITDGATATAVIGEISRIEPLFDVKG